MKSMGKVLLAAFIIFLGITVPSEAGQTITAAGSSTIRPILKEAAKEFEKIHPGVKFVIGGGGSSQGVRTAATGEVLIGMASRNLKEKEKVTWPDLIPVKIGLDGIAIIVHPENPLSKITKEQMQDIYTGKITNWTELGGSDLRIILISKEEGRSTLDLFLKYFDLEAKEVRQGRSTLMVHRKKGDRTYGAATAELIGPNIQALNHISMRPSAIGYVSVGTAQEMSMRNRKVKLLDLDGAPATIRNVGNETYPLRRPLHVVTKGQPTGMVEEFIDFLVSEKGQKIVRSHEFIPIQ